MSYRRTAPRHRRLLAFGEVTLTRTPAVLVSACCRRPLLFCQKRILRRLGRCAHRIFFFFTPVAALALSQGVRRLSCSSSECDPCQPSLLVFRIWIVNRRAVACFGFGVCSFGLAVS